MVKTLFKPVDIAPLIVFRIIFGFLIACESFGAIITGWVKNVLIEPKTTFSFIGLEWLQPLPNNGMYYYFIGMGILGFCIMFGFRYRFSIVCYTLMWASVYFMQKSSYNNHYYLLLLISFLMIWLPAHKDKSFDVKFGYTKKEQLIPQWILFLFITQIALVYFFAAIAKFYPGWLNGTFTKNLLQGTTTNNFFLTLFSKSWFYLFIAYSGILFDLLIVPLLLSKKTRTLALIASFGFHLFNAIFLQIGIFPFFALSFALFFYNPTKIRTFFFRETKIDSPFIISPKKNIFYFLIIPYLIIQIILPIRHHFIEGDVLWTEEGHRLSWRMMLRERRGYINIKVKNNQTGKTLYYNYNKNLTRKQASQLAIKPDFIWQYCQKIKKEYNGNDISIYIECKNSINRTPYKPLIDPDFDMAKAEWDYFCHNKWIILHH